MKVFVWVEQWMHALFECSEDVNEITKYRTTAVLWWILRDFIVLAKIDFRGYVTIWSLTSEISSVFEIISVYLSLPLFNFTQGKNVCIVFIYYQTIDTQYVSGFFSS